VILEQERAAVCTYARRMAGDGLVVGTSGNLSARAGNLVAVSPSGVDYARLEPADVLVDRMRGRSSLWTRVRVNLQHVPVKLRPRQERLDPDEKTLESS